MLTAVSGGATVMFAYDPIGRLTTTATPASTTFLYDNDRLSAEYSAVGAVLRRYVHGPGVDEPIVWYEGAGTTDRRWLHQDRQGSVIGWSDGSGTVSASTVYKYGPWGEPGDNWGAGSRFRYTGQIAIPEARLYHYKARMYDPATGRFMQTDPIGYQDDLDLYAYVGGDPVNNSDPSGLELVAETLGYRLGHSNVLGEYGHAYTQVRDTETGETYVLRGGPTPSFNGGPREVLLGLQDSAGSVLTAQVDPFSSSPDTKKGGYAEQNGGASLVDRQSLGDMKMTDAVSRLQGVEGRVNAAGSTYSPLYNSSNRVANEGFEALAGRPVEPFLGSRAYPGGISQFESAPPAPICELQECPAN